MSEGGIPVEVPTPESGQQNPTGAEVERPKTETPAIIENPAAVETVRPTPTEASKSFLQRFGKAILKNSAWPLSTAFAINMFSPVSGDLAQGDYRSVAVKGLIVAGSALLPAALKRMEGKGMPF